MVMILTFCHKMQNRVGGRAVCRFLGPPVGDLLVMFIVLVQPFASFLRSATGQPVARAEFLFSSDGVKSCTAENFAHQVTALSERIIGVSLNIQTWRQIAIGIDRRLLQGKGQKTHDDDDDDDDINDGDELEINALQASHSVQVGNTFYGNRIDLGQGLTDSILHQYRQPKSPPQQVAIPQLVRPSSEVALT
ncbi:MAG: hypothetical protein M1815_002710 [Lichina confinis]|nr:MAG: hypothetical protein M1815_002710 [Lichina confinis]